MQSTCATGPDGEPSEAVRAFIQQARMTGSAPQRPAFKGFHRFIDQYLDAAGPARGRPYGERQRARVHELVPEARHSLRNHWFEILQDGIRAKGHDQRDAILREFVMMALWTPGARY